MIRINNTQYPHFLEQADALRRSGTLCDAVISVKSHTFKAHRLVLACASRRLAQQLSKGDTDSPSCCTLEQFSPHTFQQILDYTYAQTLEVHEEDLYLLLRAAQLLEMQLLADQCRKELDALNQRLGEDNGKEEEKSPAQETYPNKKELAHEDKVQGNLSTEDMVDQTIVAENHSTHVLAGNHNSSSCPRQKARLSPIPSTPDSRYISVITRPVTSSPSVLPACNFPSNKWPSVSTLRKIAENYSSIFPLPPLNQSSVAYPFSLSKAHLFPLLSPHFQSQVHSPVMGYPAFYPYHTQNRCTTAASMSSIIKQGLLKRKRTIHRTSSGSIQDGRSFHRVPKTSSDRIRDCQNCSSSPSADSAPRNTASTLSGKVCEGCRFCRKKYGLKRKSQSKHHDQRGDKPYQCRHCPKKFSLKHQLDTHHRVHTGEKPFECRLCGQRSRDYSAMIKHLRTHGGATPYRCTVCLEFCSSLATMQKHIRNHAMQDFPPDWSISSTYLYISHI